MNVKNLVVGALIGAGLGFAVAWVAKPATEPQTPSRPRAPAENAQLDKPTGPKAMYTGDDIDAARADERKKAKDAADKEIAKAASDAGEKSKSLEGQVESLRKELEQARTAKPDVKAEPAKPEVPDKPPARELPVKFGKWAEMDEVRGANWEEMADAMRAMQKGIREVRQAEKEGREPDPDTQAEIGKQNQKLVNYVIRVLRKLPTHAKSGNGEFTHPITVVNLLAYQLQAAGKPLSEAQMKQLSEYGAEYEKRWEALQASYTAQSLALEKTLDEIELKQWFVDQMFGALAADQREVVEDPETRGMVMQDLYSPGLMLAGVALPLAVASKEELRAMMLDNCVKAWKLDAAQVQAQGYIFDAWMNDIATLLVPVPAKTAESFSLQQALLAGRAQIKAMKELITAMALSDEAAKRVREEGRFGVPRIAQPE